MAGFAQEMHGLAHDLKFCVYKPGQHDFSHLVPGKVLTSLDHVSLHKMWLGNTSPASLHTAHIAGPCVPLSDLTGNTSPASLHTTFVKMNCEETEIM